MDQGQRDSRAQDEARSGLRNELSQVVGEDAAAKAEREGALDSAMSAGRPRTVAGAISESRVLIGITFFVALIVGAVIALITGSWVFLLVALVLHAIGTVVVVTTGLTLATQTESPDPRTAAALEARGVRNPDAALQQAVDSVSDDSEEAARSRDQETEITPSPRSREAGFTPPRRPEGGHA